MRTDEEFLAAMHKRAAGIERETRGRRAKLLGGGAVLGGIAAVVLLALLTPSIQTAALPAEASFRASIFADAGALGYVVVGVTAFLLGTAVTVLCYRLRKNRDDGDDEP